MDYPDPANFINVLLDGRRIQADNNVNESYFNNPKYNARMDKAYGLAGQARLTAYAAPRPRHHEERGAGRPVHLDERPHPDQHRRSAATATRSIQGTLLTQICTK